MNLKHSSIFGDIEILKFVYKLIQDVLLLLIILLLLILTWKIMLGSDFIVWFGLKFGINVV